jgi:hypothetical protein
MYPFFLGILVVRRRDAEGMFRLFQSYNSGKPSAIGLLALFRRKSCLFLPSLDYPETTNRIKSLFAWEASCVDSFRGSSRVWS